MRVPKWMNPTWVALLWLGVGTGSVLVSSDSYQIMMRTQKYIDFDAFLTVSCLIFAFFLCAFISVNTGRTRSYETVDSLEILAAFTSHRQTIGLVLSIYLLCCLAYFLWFLPTFNLSVLKQILVMHAIKGREVGSQISGVTTMTQFGSVLTTIAALALCNPNRAPRKIRVFYRTILISLIVFATYRALIWSERLGLIEVGLPAITVYFCFKIRKRILAESAPLFAIFAMIFVFGAFEYFRSWQFYKDEYSSIVTFSTERFLSYYYTSFNNFGMLYHELDVSNEPVNILRFLYTLPIPFNPLAGKFEELTDGDLLYALKRYVNPEFNLFTAPGLVFFDVGLLLGAVVFGFLGFVSGKIFKSFKRKNGLGLFLYPIWMIGLFEVGRELFWTSGRALPQIVGALFFAYLFNRYRRRKIARLIANEQVS